MARHTAEARGRLAAVYGPRRFAILFYTLLFTLAAAPLFTALGFGADLIQICLAFSLLASLLGVPSQGWRRVLLLLAAVAVGVRLVPASAVGAGFSMGSLLLVSLLGLLAAASAVRFAMRAKAIAGEHIYAALSAYLLAGLFFGVLHWMIESVWPGSLGPPGAAGTPAGFSLSTAIYYSFVTLATLGYGDVVPRTEVARGFAVLEAVGGQLYIAVMIARLVGAKLQSRDEP